MSFHLNYEPSTLSMKSRLKLSCFAGAPFVFALLRACTAWFVLLLFVSLSLPAMRGVCRRCGLSARGPHCARRHLNSSACGRCCWTTCCSEYKHTNITTHIHTCVHTYILLDLVPRQASQRSRGAPPPPRRCCRLSARTRTGTARHEEETGGCGMRHEEETVVPPPSVRMRARGDG